MRTATHLQLIRFKCVAFVQQKYHNSISSVKGFLSIFERKCKKSKISRSKTFHKRNKFIQDTVNLLRPCCASPFFRIVSSHLTCCILFFYTFSAVFFMHFSVCLFTYMHISKCNRLLCALFRFTPLPQPFSGLQPAFGCTFCNKKQHRQPFQGHLCCAVFLI